MIFILDQEKTGGPRAGRGAAARAAMCAAAIGRRACARGCSAGWLQPAGGAGIAPPEWMHKGQSSVWPRCSCAPSSLSAMSLISPAAEQISSMACGLTKGDAVATPTATANQASMKQASKRRRRREDMGTDCRVRQRGCGPGARLSRPSRRALARIWPDRFRRPARAPASLAGRWRAAYAAALQSPAAPAAPIPT